MKCKNHSRKLVTVATLLVIGAAAAFGQGGQGGGASGTPGLAGGPLVPGVTLIASRGGRGGGLTDLELTAIARAEETLQKQIDAVVAARVAADNATFAQPLDRRDLTEKLQALSKAELDNALALAGALPKLLAELKDATPAKQQAVRTAFGNPGGGGRGGGGGGGRGGLGAPVGAATNAPATGPRGGN